MGVEEVDYVSPYQTTYDSSCAFDLSQFHSDPGCECVLIASVGHSHGLIYCRTCKVAVDVEAFGRRVTIQTAGISSHLAAAASKTAARK